MKEEIVQNILSKTSLPVIAAPMFLVSSPHMVIESCKAGIVGSFPLLNARTEDILEGWMKQITEELELEKAEQPNKRIAPWAVNFIVHRTNKRFDIDLELIKKYQPPIVITSLGNPSSIVSIVHEYGGVVFSDVSNIKHAKKAAETGVDGLILVCNGAGGHAGIINPMAFMGEVKGFWNGMTILAGCISRGEDILAAQALGADLAYMGTRFIPTTESFAANDYKNMLVESTLDDLIYTDAFSGVKANYLIPSIKKTGLNIEELTKKESVDFSNMDNSNAKAWKDIWSAGQGVSTIDKIIPTAQVVQELRQEYEQALSTLLSKQST